MWVPSTSKHHKSIQRTQLPSIPMYAMPCFLGSRGQKITHENKIVLLGLLGLAPLGLWSCVALAPRPLQASWLLSRPRPAASLFFFHSGLPSSPSARSPPDASSFAEPRHLDQKTRVGCGTFASGVPWWLFSLAVVWENSSGMSAT